MDDTKPSHRDIRDSRKADTRRWLQQILETKKLKPPTLAQELASAGFPVTASTLYRILDEDDPVTPDAATIEKIELGTGFRFVRNEALSLQRPPGLSEGDAVRIDIVPAGFQPGPDQGVWRLQNRVIELAGFLPGDLILFDATAPRKAGGIVVAQVENRAGGADTVIRVYDPPYLVSRTVDPVGQTKPLVVDDERVRIWGGFVRMLRTADPL